jgi:hypothetical protein
MEPAVTTVKEAVTSVSIMNHVKANRIEYALCLIALHLLGASDLVITKVSGVCF